MGDRKPVKAKDSLAPRKGKPPYHSLVMDRNGLNVELREDKVLTFTISGARFDVSIGGRGLSSYLNVRCPDGVLSVSAGCANELELRMTRPL